MTYQCQSCTRNVSFPNKAILKNHIIKCHANILWETEMKLKDQATITNFDDVTQKMEQLKFACTICDARFLTKNWLREHLKKTHGLLYSCLKCEDMFDTSQKLANHMMHSHGAIVKCTKCSSRFKKIADLATHVKVAHISGPEGVTVKNKPDSNVTRYRIIPTPTRVI